jgi:hypothetical protein
MRKEKPSQSCWANLRTRLPPGGMCDSYYFGGSACYVMVSMFTVIIRVVEIGPACRFDRVLKSTLPLLIVTWPVASASLGGPIMQEA